jgi:acyl-CoA dehydrogenase
MIRHPETFNQLSDMLARFVRERLLPAEQQVEEADSIPQEIVDEMKALGLFGLPIPEEFGGLGLTMEEEALIAFELGHTSPAFRSLIATNNGIGSQGLIMDGTARQKAQYLPRMASGEIIGSFALTEAGAGSDAGSVRTRAVRDGDSYIVNGSKRFITNAPRAAVFKLMARTDPGEKGAAGVSAFIVDASSPGIR